MSQEGMSGMSRMSVSQEGRNVSQSVSLSDRKEGWKEEGKPPERFVLLAQNREIMDIRQGIPSVNQKSH